MRRSRVLSALAVGLLVVGAACVPSPSDPPDDPWGDGCNDDRHHFKESPANRDAPGEWWYTGGTGANASVQVSDEHGAPNGFGCHAAELRTGAPGAAAEDNAIELTTLSKFDDAKLLEVDTMRYSTYRSSQSSGTDRVGAAMHVSIISLFAGNDLTTTLYYEPHRQSGGAALLQDDIWQTWDPNVGRWWVEDDGPGSLHSWLEIKLKFPDAAVLGHGISVLPGHPDQVIAVDGIRFDDMRTNMGATFPDQPTGGWPVIPLPEADNVAATAGEDFSCALKVDGRISCWGIGDDGQLGNGSRSERRSGVAVAGIDDAVGVTAGDHHACALSDTGGVRCWGRNDLGQLGSGSTSNDSTTPVQVVGLTSGVTDIDAQGDVTCAALDDGTARCWGLNDRGQLGNGGSGTDPTVFSNVPVAVSGLGSVVEVAAGSCARTSDGAVHCWGPGARGRVGDGGTDDRTLPVAVTGLAGSATSIATSDALTCAGTASGLKCWGRVNAVGFDSTVPAPIAGVDSPVVSVDAWSGGFHGGACAITGSGGASCWGSDALGELGDGEPFQASPSAVAVKGLTSGVGSISRGPLHACAVAVGLAHCWGSNIDAQLGDGTTFDAAEPVIARARV